MPYPTRTLRYLATLVACAVALTIAAAHLQDREREALRRAQQMIGKLQQDTAALQREKVELERKLKAADD